MPDIPNSKLNEDELRIGILRILEHMRKSSDDQPGGASGLVLMELLGLSDIKTFEKPLLWLKENGYIEIGVRKFLISESGQEYLRSNFK